VFYLHAFVDVFLFYIFNFYIVLESHCILIKIGKSVNFRHICQLVLHKSPFLINTG
jgi:hypothetical protein